MKFCPKCGNPTDDHATFCNQCGAPLNDQPNTTAKLPEIVQSPFLYAP